MLLLTISCSNIILKKIKVLFDIKLRLLNSSINYYIIFRLYYVRYKVMALAKYGVLNKKVLFMC